MSLTGTRLKELFIGQCPHRSAFWTAGAILVFAGWLVASGLQDTLGKPVNTPFEPVVDLVFLLAVTGTLALPVIHAYRNEGWVVCSVLGAIPGFVLGWNRILIVGPEMTLKQRFVQGTLHGAATAIAFGTVAFLLGIGLAHWRSSF